jgi:putative serine protease PepD
VSVADESLRVVAGKASGTEIPVDGEFLIGRATTGDGRLGDDPELSRQHARIVRRAGGQLTIEDLGSTNGTFVNGKKVTDQPQPLRPGDTIKVGTTTLQVLDATGNAPQATALGTVPTPGEQATAAGAASPPPPPPAPAAPAPPTPAPQAPAAPAPAAPGPPTPARPAPAAPAPPGRVPPPPPAAPPSRPSRKGPPVPVIAGLAGLIVVGVVAFLLLSGGDDDNGESETPTVLTSGQIASQNENSTVSINTRGPGFDADGNEAVVSGGGTGVVIDAQRGHVLTNDHVVAGATSVKARMENGEEVNARVLGQAPCEDLAVIELSPKPRGLKQAKLGSSARVKAGDKVTALGFPGAFEEDITQRKLQSTEGTISSKPSSATLGSSLPTLPSVIQHQAPISPGNSGGPLFNDQGQVIGINTLAATSESGSQNQNGAIAIDRAKSLMPKLKNGEDQGYVGWTLQNVADLNNDLYVLGVDSNSPADKANMLFGDRVDEIDNTQVESIPDVCDILGSKAKGDSVKVSGQQLDQQFYTTTIRLR